MRALPAVLLVGAALIGGAGSPDGPVAESGGGPGDGTSPTSDPPDEIRDADGGSTGTIAGTGGGGTRIRALAPFADCTTFLDHVKAEARERVGPYGLDMYPVYWFEDVMMEETAAEDMAAAPASADTADSGQAVATTGEGGALGGFDGEFTGTNVQELGIDEADIVKTDGRRILSISNGVLTYVDLTGETPTVSGRLALGDSWGHEMFVSGDRAIVLTNAGTWGGPVPVEPIVVEDTVDAATGSLPPDGRDAPIHQGPAAIVMEIDLSNPAAMRVANTLRIEGQYLSARSIDDHVRLAVTSTPIDLPWVYPQSESGEDRAEETNRQIIEESTLDDWTPSFEITGDGGQASGPLLACEQMHRPGEFSGFDIVSVIDLDLSAGLSVGAGGPAATGVLASGQTVYSSLDRFYVATTKWAGTDLPADDRGAWSEDFSTQIHAFAIAPGQPTTYVASGAVDGSLLNQFSLDEHEGYLRVVTTTGSPWDAADQSESVLVVLQEQGDRLVPVGSVGGLGRGEQLYSARLMGDIGFAVTFRQIDPFYVLDLSEPTAPAVVGELKIPGVSTYLHQVDDRHVLGIGQDATEDGRTIGLKLSLFDVSNPADPREVSVWTLPDAGSAAEYDHRAFQMWGSTAIVPVQSWRGDGFNGAIVFDVGGVAGTITEVGRVEHVPDGGEPSSDCRNVTTEGLTPDASEIWYVIQDASAHVQVCGPDAVGGWGTWQCDPVPAEELQWWFWDETTADADLAALGMGEGDRLEICWPDEYGQHSIQRSLVVDDLLWTVSPSIIQSNSLSDLRVIDRLVVR